jgi:S-adenosyl methyltransferase
MNRLDASSGRPPTDPDQPAVHESPHPVTLTGQQSFDSGVPNVARIYDALLGGKDNYATDREAALALTTAIPGAALAARDNRAFLARAVRYLAGQAGITQFLDIGTGLPTRGHVHEIAQAANPGARVAYVTDDQTPAEAIDRARDIYSTAYVRGAARTRDDIEGFFDGLDLIPPGVTDAARWRSRRRAAPRPALFYAGIGRKPGKKETP